MLDLAQLEYDFDRRDIVPLSSKGWTLDDLEVFIEEWVRQKEEGASDLQDELEEAVRAAEGVRYDLGVVEEELSDAESRVYDLETRNEELEGEVFELQENKDTLQQDLWEAEDQITLLEEQVATLEDRLATYE